MKSDDAVMRELSINRELLILLIHLWIDTNININEFYDNKNLSPIFVPRRTRLVGSRAPSNNNSIYNNYNNLLMNSNLIRIK